MEWEFTPEQVVKAEVDYGFENFRGDLYREVVANLGAAGAAQIEPTFKLLFDLCYWQATGRPFDTFVAQHHHSPPVGEFLHGVREAMAPNVDMLGAILQRMLITEVENGAQLEDSLLSVDASVRRMTATLPACAAS
jgi:hypothetical protein